MATRRLNLVLAILLAATVVLTWSVRPATRRPMGWFPWSGMVHPVAFAAYSANPAMADGKTLQAPPFGTLARGEQVFPYGPSPEEAARAGRELTNPCRADDAAAVERGTWVYQTYCVPCHGDGGLGDGTVARRGFPAPPSLLADHARQLADGQIFHIVTWGQKNMPSHRAQVPPEDRWKVVLFIRQLQATAGEGTAQP